MIVDTTVMVDLTRDRKEARQFLITNPQEQRISRISVMEIVEGLQTQQAIAVFKKQLTSLALEIVEIDQSVSEVAGTIFEQYYHSNGIGISDALIAATALVFREQLITHNTKHFQFISDLAVKVPY